MSQPPAHAQVLVVGGGPAGAYAASALAREGIDVVLFEAARFPRYHIGESLIPSVRPYLRFIDAERKVEASGFAKKPGAAIKFNQYKEEGYTDFLALGHNNNAWNVPRADFDALLLAHAGEQGAQVFEGIKVTGFESRDGLLKAATEDGKLERPAAATYVLDDKNKSERRITFDYIVDASGRAGLLSTTYLKSRRFTESLKNIAVWGYWRGTSAYLAGSGLNRENAAYFEALTDESGWAWFIPLHNGTTSVGVVMNQTSYKENIKFDKSTMVERYTSFLELAPHVKSLIAAGTLVTDAVGPDEKGVERAQPAVKMASDFSYNSDCYGGEGWRIAGDAGAFIDPFFSSGIHLAFTGGLSAAATIAASIRGDCPEGTAAEYHTQRFAVSYTRFFVVVMGAYKQIRAQSRAVLSDVDERGFARAFAAIRPLIQGAADMGGHLSSEELNNALEFCGKLFAPTTPEMHDKLKDGKVEGEWLDVHSPVRSATEMKEKLVEGGEGNEEAMMVLEKVNARRVMHKEHGGTSNFEDEPMEIGGDGWVVRLQRGGLGLVRVRPANGC